MLQKSRLLLFILFPLLAFSQNKDSVVARATQTITQKFPTTRVFDMQFENLGTTNFHNELFDKGFQEGKIDNSQRLKMALNLPIYRKKQLIVSGSLRYKYENYNIAYTRNTETNQLTNNYSQHLHYFLASASVTYFSTLFNKNIIYNASSIVDGNEKAPQRLKGFLSAILVLKKTERTTITTGLIGFVDVTSIVPMVPAFSYEHQFKNSEWQLDFVMPQRLLLKRKLLNHGRLALGTELNNESFYVDIKSSKLNGVYEYSQMELRSGIKYEYKISKYLYANFKTGLSNMIRGRLTERGEKTTNYVLDMKQDPTFYINFGASFNPF